MEFQLDNKLFEKGCVTVDGRRDEPVWQEAKAFTGFTLLASRALYRAQLLEELEKVKDHETFIRAAAISPRATSLPTPRFPQ